MTGMRASRKGTRLNEARYFRIPLPYAHKRMTVRVLPRVADPSLEVFDDMTPNPEPGATKQNNKDRGETQQSSVEVAPAECHGLEDENEEKCQGMSEMGTEEIVEFPTEQREDVATTVPRGPERSIDSPRTQKEGRENARGTVREEKLRGNRLKRGRKSVDRKQHCGDRGAAEGEKRAGGSWWKDGGQTILQFFAKILGKRGGMNAEGATGRVLPSGNKRHGERVKRVSRGDGSRNARGRAAGARLKRVSNGYITNHAYRNESRRRNVAEDKSRLRCQREEEPRPSILLRQIQRTRDKNLRVALLEQELRSHAPFARNVVSANRALRLGQLSSPLC